MEKDRQNSNARFERGVDMKDTYHYGCEGTIMKLVPSMYYCGEARCEKCGKQGPTTPVRNEDGHDLYKIDHDPTNNPGVEAFMVDSYSGRYVVFEHEVSVVEI